MSRVYKPQRIMGLVANHVPAVVQNRGTEHFVTTCVGKAFNTYNCKKLTLQFVSPLHDSDISCLVGHKDYIFTAADKMVYSWIRGKLVRCYPGHTADVAHLMPFGDHIISFGEDKRMMIHDMGTGEEYADVWMSETVTAVSHPATYLNKVLIGYSVGTLELWNVRTLKLIHRFAPMDSPITVITQSPGVDIMGIGLKNGKIKMHNIKTDETLMTFYQDWGCVTSLSFRTDGSAAHVVSGSVEGHMAVWDLEKQQLHSTIRQAHHSCVASTVYLASQPLLLTTSADNAIKIWVFDGPGGTARLLKERSGHRAPPTTTCFYGASAENVLSAGYDKSVRMFCVIKDERSKELSQGSMESKSKKLDVKVDELKLPPVTALAAEEIRERDWSNVITAHAGSREVRMWNTVSGALHSKSLIPKLETIVVTAVEITVCGNIGIVGYNSGHLTAFNLQSGINRGLFGNRLAHRSKITGISADNTNHRVVSVGQDALVKVWNLMERTLQTTVALSAPAVRCTLHRDSNLLAVALNSNNVVLIDIDTSKIVREFKHRATISDLCYSPDGKTLLVATQDSAVRLWDLLTARLLDCFATHSPVTSLSLSRDSLVTTHLNELGIYIWTNKTLYETVELKAISEDSEPVLVTMFGSEPVTQETMDVEEESGEVWKSSSQITEDLITLSTAPKAKWTTLCNLETIKKRNKPVEPPTAPKAAPFFLTTTRDLVPKFVVEEKEEDGNTEKMKPVRDMESEFQRVIMQSSDPSEILKFLESSSPSFIDIELQSLAPMDGGSHELVEKFLDFLLSGLQLRSNYDMVQAYLAVFLKYNRKYLIETRSLHDKLRNLKSLHSDTWTDLQLKIQECLCVTNFLKNATL